MGIDRAQAANIAVKIVTPGPDFSKRVFDAVSTWQPDLVILAGWLHLLQIPPDYQGRVLNIHPSLLPAFGGKGMYGRHVHEAVIAAGVTESGCTVHYVNDDYDAGPIIAQRKVCVLPDDTPETLAARVFEAECELYPEVISQLIAQRQTQLATGL
jgi:phosphoribosylglycinamide formyltransferase-1